MLASLAAPGFGAAHAELMDRLPNIAAHIALMIDGFHPSETGGTVKLRPSGAPLLDYVIPQRIFEGIAESQKVLAKVQLASGAVSTHTSHDPPFSAKKEGDISSFDRAPYESNKLTVFSAHVMGGSAMNDDPQKGVVRSEDLALHALDDVHVIDGSVFPTSLGVNPQLSIYGLSHLTATRLAARWKA
jgi:choline dehydrogenase-like flavoprotein